MIILNSLRDIIHFGKRKRVAHSRHLHENIPTTSVPFPHQRSALCRPPHVWSVVCLCSGFDQRASRLSICCRNKGFICLPDKALGRYLRFQVKPIIPRRRFAFTRVRGGFDVRVLGTGSTRKKTESETSVLMHEYVGLYVAKLFWFEFQVNQLLTLN